LGPSEGAVLIRGPLEATTSDVKATRYLLRRCFPHDSDLSDSPSSLAYSKRIIEDSLILKQGRKVVSHVGVVHQTVMADAGELDAAGVGWVATEEGHRGRGFMSTLLAASILKMRDEGAAISELGGDRRRYGRFGWELAGMTWRYSVTARSFGDRSNASRYQVEGDTAVPQNVVDATLDLHNSQHVGVRRDRRLHRILLSRDGRTVLSTRKEDEIDSYAVVRRLGDHYRIEEFSGSRRGMYAMLAHLLNEEGVEWIDVRLPRGHPLNGLLRSFSSMWHLACLRMIKIIDLQSTLEGVSPQLLSRYRSLGMEGIKEVTLAVRGTERATRVRIAPEGISLAESRPGRDAIELPEREMVHLIFGPGHPLLPDHTGQRGLMEALFPVDFYLWPNEMI